MSKNPTEKKITNDSGGFLSVNREKAIKENWSDILTMKRPATMPVSTEKPAPQAPQQKPQSGKAAKTPG